MDKEIKDRVGQAVAYNGTDIFNDTNVHRGNWKSFVIADSTTQIANIIDDGEDKSTIPLNTALPAGIFVSANGTFVRIELAVAGMIIMGKAQ